MEKIKIEDQLLSVEAERDKAISRSQSIQESHAHADEEIGRLKRRVDELLLEKSALNKTLDDQIRETDRIKNEWTNDLMNKKEEMHRMMCQVL